MAFTKAERAARYRAAHPDRVEAYQTSPRGRALRREAMRRFRAKNPKIRKPLPPPVSRDEDATRHAAYMRKYKARMEGYAHCDEIPPQPTDGCCQKCRAHTSLVPDHDHKTGAFRGWLCLQCNMGIGQLGDTREGLMTAVAYLDGELPWQTNSLPGINGALGFGA
jgi:hypothetical protein